MPAPTNLFFMGKGGVGKSTLSALYSVFLAKKGFRVLLVSLDPAHNLSDIFKKKMGNRPVDIAAGLSVVEIDQEKWIKIYLKDIRQQINRTYSYLTAFNLDKYFGIIKHSPGLEEYALIMAFTHIVNTFSHHDFLVLDMPPTALSLKFFALPTLSLVWIEQLLTLRREIIQKKKMITKIKLIKKETEQDKVLNKINTLKEEYFLLKNLFSQPDKTRVHLVTNPDKLAFAESLRIVNALENINIRIDHLLYNKTQKDVENSPDDPTFSKIPKINFPQSKIPLIGYDALKDFLHGDNHFVEQQLARVFEGTGR